MFHRSDQRLLHGTDDPNFERQFCVASSQGAGDFLSSQRGYHPYSRPSVEALAEEGDSFEGRWEVGGYFGPQAGGTSSEGDVGVGGGASGFAAGPSGTQRTLDTTGLQNGVFDGQKDRAAGPFPRRFYRDPGARGIIEWNEAGEKVIVVDHTALENSEILSHYFNHNKARWTSVVKQLGNHLFTKENHAKKGGRSHIYYHQNFLRDREELLDLIKPKAPGSDPPKTLIAKLQKKLEELKMELSRSEAKVSQLEKDKKRLEDKNKRLVDKNKRLEDETIRLEYRNETLEGRNERLHVENGRLEGQLLTFQMRPPQGAAQGVPSIPLDYYQAAGNGHLQAGGATPNHSQQWSYPNQPLLNTVGTINQPSDQQVSNYDLVQGTGYPNLPYQQPFNALGTMISSSSGPCEAQSSGQEAISAHAVGSQPSGSQVARQPSPKAPGVVHTRSGVSFVSQQQPQSQETWFSNLLTNITGFSSHLLSNGARRMFDLRGAESSMSCPAIMAEH